MLHMSVYLVADIDVHDPEMYEEYSRAAQATFRRPHEGRSPAKRRNSGLSKDHSPAEGRAGRWSA
jgi:hypothetical protein